MATLAGGNVITLTTPDSPLQPGRVLQSRTLVNPIKVVNRVVDEINRNPLVISTTTTVSAGPAKKPAVVPVALREANLIELTTFGPDWFEKIHVLPRDGFKFGNIISDANFPIEVFNAFRLMTINFTAFLNNTGPGISLDPDPTPVGIDRLHSLDLSLLVEAQGSSSFDSTLDFTFDGGVGIISLPASGSRIVLWGFPPELPFNETLAFLTDIIPKQSGKEQRISLRKAPRQTFEYTFFVEEGPERQYAESVLFDWQASVFGIPVWHESTFSTAAVALGDTTVAVQSTDFRDFRVGGQVILWSGIRTFSVMTIAVVNANSIDFTAQIGDAFPAGVQVMPVRDQVLTNSRIQASRNRVNFSEITIVFKVVDNDISLGSTVGWPTYNGKVLLDGPNMVAKTMRDTYERDLEVIDGRTGIFKQESLWAQGKRAHMKTFKVTGLEALWKLRQLLHSLHGQQVSWYIPSFSDDMFPFDTFSSGGNVMPIDNIGYAQFIQARQPKNVVRVTLTNGTQLIREITGATEINAEREDLIVDVNWPSTIQPEDVVRMEYIEKVRFASDKAVIVHDEGGMDRFVSIPVKDVFDDI